MLWPTPAQGVQLRAVGMQAVLWPTPAQGVQLHAVGMQAGHAGGMQAGHAGGMQVGRAVANAGAGGAAACSRHAGGACRWHAGGMQVGRAVANAAAGGAVGMCKRGIAGGMAACRWGALCVAEQGQRHAGGSQAACRSKRPGPAKIATQNSTKLG